MFGKREFKDCVMMEARKKTHHLLSIIIIIIITITITIIILIIIIIISTISKSIS